MFIPGTGKTVTTCNNSFKTTNKPLYAEPEKL